LTELRSDKPIFLN